MVNYESTGELAPAPAESSEVSVDVSLPEVIENDEINSHLEDDDTGEGDVLEGDYIKEIDEPQASLESGGEGDLSANEGMGGVGYSTEIYQEYAPIERKRKLFELLFEKLLSALLGVHNVELGEVIASRVRYVPVGFSEYITEKARQGVVPSYDEMMEKFPDLEFVEEETKEE